MFLTNIKHANSQIQCFWDISYFINKFITSRYEIILITDANHTIQKGQPSSLVQETLTPTKPTINQLSKNQFTDEINNFNDLLSYKKFNQLTKYSTITQLNQQKNSQDWLTLIIYVSQQHLNMESNQWDISIVNYHYTVITWVFLQTSTSNSYLMIQPLLWYHLYTLLRGTATKKTLIY